MATPDAAQVQAYYKNLSQLLLHHKDEVKTVLDLAGIPIPVSATDAQMIDAIITGLGNKNTALITGLAALMRKYYL